MTRSAEPKKTSGIAAKIVEVGGGKLIDLVCFFFCIYFECFSLDD